MGDGTSATPKMLVRRPSGSNWMKRMAFYNDSWDVLLNGLPRFNLPVRARVRMQLRDSTLGHTWEVFQTLFALAACILYVVQTYMQDLETGLFDTVALIVFATDYLLNFYCCENRWTFVISFSAILDMITILPPVIDRAVHQDIRGSGSSFPFIRFIRVLRLLRLTRLIKFTGSRSISAVQKQIQTIVLLISCIIFIAAGVFHVVESQYRLPADPKITFGESLYYLVVTVATVGYGDITPLTTYGKLVATSVIITAFTIIPTEVSRLTQLMSLQSPFRKTYQPTIGNPHVLVVGHILEPHRLLGFFKEFYHPDRVLDDQPGSTISDPPCVLMAPHEPGEAIINLLDHPVLQNRVNYIKGSLMVEEDLWRVGADSARACFVLGDKSSQNTDKADAETVIRLLAIRQYNPELETYTQISSPTFVDYLTKTEINHVLCINQIKMSILAKSCLCPGLIPLISNMFRSSTGETNSSLSWQKEYVGGLSLEIYATTLPPAYYGLSFSQTCRVVYQSTHGNVVLLGVLECSGVRNKSKSASSPSAKVIPTQPVQDSHVLYINPGSTIMMEAGQIVYVLSESKQLAMSSALSSNLKDWLNAGNTLPLPMQSPDALMKLTPDAQLRLTPIALPNRRTRRDPEHLVIEEAVDPATGNAIKGHIIVVTELDEDKIQLFIEPLRLAQYAPGNPGYYPIIFLTWSGESCAQVLKILLEYQHVYLMRATSDSKAELLRANVLKAKRCVMMADRSHVHELDGEPIDSRTIFHYLAVQSIQTEHRNEFNADFYTVVELSEPRTMTILDSALRKRVTQRKGTKTETFSLAERHLRETNLIQPEKSSKNRNVVHSLVGNSLKHVQRNVKSVLDERKRLKNRISTIRKEQDSTRKTFTASSSTILPFFAAGYGFCDDMFDNMLCQCYFTPGFMRFAHELLFSEEGQTAEMHRRSRHSIHGMRINSSKLASSLKQVALPVGFEKRTFGELFEHLILQQNTVAIALYRGFCASRSSSSSSLPYVVTGPSPDTVLAAEDLVFVLAQPKSMHQVDEFKRKMTDADPRDVQPSF